MEQGNKVICTEEQGEKRHQFKEQGNTIFYRYRKNMYPHILHYTKYDGYIYIALPCSVETGNIWATTIGSFLALIYGFILFYFLENKANNFGEQENKNYIIFG